MSLAHGRCGRITGISGHSARVVGLHPVIVFGVDGQSGVRVTGRVGGQCRDP